MSTNYFAKAQNETFGKTGTGLDQLVDVIANDIRMNGTLSQADMQQGIEATNKLLNLILESMDAVGVAKDGSFNAEDMQKIAQHIREERAEEYAVIQKLNFTDGEGNFGSTHFNGKNVVGNLLDALSHIGNEVRGDSVTDELGRTNASFERLGEILSDFWVDRSTTNSGLDHVTDNILADKWMYRKVSDADRYEGAEAADAMNKLILEAVEATGAAKDGAIDVADVQAINAYIQENHAQAYAALYGTSESRSDETGFQNLTAEGGRRQMFGERMIDKSFDTLYNVGRENLGGKDEASVQKMADMLNYFVVDQGTTGTGLDELVQILKTDRGLAYTNDAATINEGATAANELNKLIVEAIEAQGLAKDGALDVNDVRAISEYIRENHEEAFLTLRGDSAEGNESGFAAVEGEGASMLHDARKVGCNLYTGNNVVDTVMDGLFHVGFEISGDKFINPTEWLKHEADQSGEYATVTKAAFGAHTLEGTEGNDRIVSYSDGGEPGSESGVRVNDEVASHLANDVLTGGAGADSFEFSLLMNAKKAIIEKHTDAEGNVNWMKVMKENKNVHDHWVEGIGNDVITDYSKAEGDKIVVRGHTVDIKSVEYGADEQGEFSLISLYSNQMKGGAHHQDALGTIKVYGDKVTAADVQLDGAMMIMDGMDILGQEFAGEVSKWGELGGNTVQDVAGWLNEFYLGKEIKFGTDADEKTKGLNTDDTIYAMGGNDKVFTRDGNDFVDGGAGNDRIKAGNGNDIALGGTGNDVITGGWGDDLLIAGQGADDLRGDGGNDVLIVESDNQRDTLRGGAGSDSFMFWMDGKAKSTDRIMDFKRAEGDEVVLGGEVASFTVKAHKKQSFINMFDENGESLGRIKVIGRISEEDVRIDNAAFQTYADELLIGGVDVSLEMEALDAVGDAVEEAPLALEVEVSTDAALVMGAQEELAEPLFTSIAVGF